MKIESFADWAGVRLAKLIFLVFEPGCWDRARREGEEKSTGLRTGTTGENEGGTLPKKQQGASFNEAPSNNVEVSIA